MKTLSASKYYLATAAAQGLMSRSSSIQVDGKWGKFTQSAYESSPADVQAAVKQVVRVLADAEIEDLRAYRDAQRAHGKAMLLSASPTGGIRDLIVALAQEEGVPTSTALKIAYLESRLNPKAVSPTGAKGVYQLTGVAISDIARRGGFTVSDPFDPMQNIRGGLRYMKIVTRDLNVSLDDTAKVYMGFNIGPTGAKHVLSGKPELAAKQINQQAYGRPSVYADNLSLAVKNAQA